MKKKAVPAGRPLGQLGEFGLIEEIRKLVFTDSKTVLLGIGDDAAVLKPSGKKRLLFTTDMLIEDEHFRLKEATPFEIGWKALAVNLSDIAAMAGAPTHAVISMGLPKKLRFGFVRELYRGMETLARRFKVNLVGGDTNRSEKLVLSVALLGEADAKDYVTRSGAEPGDVIFVSGFLGGSYASKKHLHFMPRIEEARFLTRHFKIHAMIDLSDGLSSDICRIAEASRVGAFLAKGSIPLSKFARDVNAAMNDGEDFELLFTLSPKEAARLTLYPFGKKGTSFHPIGRIVEKKYGVRLVDKSGKSAPLAGKGFDHFLRKRVSG